MSPFPTHIIRKLPSFQPDGTLPPGDYAPSEEDFKAAFAREGVRKNLYDGWRRLRAHLLDLGVPGSSRVLFFGSFVTTKERPAEVDLVVAVGAAKPQEKQTVSKLMDLSQRRAKEQFGCDVYFFEDVPPELDSQGITGKTVQYWMQLAAIDRRGQSRGRVWGTVAETNYADSTDSVDMDYVLSLSDSGKLVLRGTSSLGFYAGQRNAGLLTASPNLLSLHSCRFGSFRPEEVTQLETLVNDPNAKEHEFQNFFERHPQFLKIFEHTDMFAHPRLPRNIEGPLIPDFILTNGDTCSGLICPDTSIGGQSTIRGDLHDKATPQFRSWL